MHWGILASAFSLLGFFSSAQAENVSNIATFHSAQEILDCVLQRQPDIQRSYADMAIKKASEITARQIPNPGFNTRTLLVTVGGPDQILSEVNIAQPIELGGKRKSRIAKALADEELSSSVAQDVKQEVIIQTVLTLHRLRQLRLEMDELDETLAIYERIREQFKNRPVLSPEQRASLAVFRTASQANQLRKVALLDEENQLRFLLEKATGQRIEIIPEILPMAIVHWPDVSPQVRNMPLDGTKIAKAQADLHVANAGYQLAKSEAWPNIDFGPSIEPDSMEREATMSYGFNMALPLPLYHQNQGQVEEALRAQNKAKLDLELTRWELEVDRASLVEKYEQNRKAVEKAVSIRAYEEKKDEPGLEKLFQDGLIPASLMIEANRQGFELLQSLNAAELRAIEALWRLYALEGRIFDEKI